MHSLKKHPVPNQHTHSPTHNTALPEDANEPRPLTQRNSSSSPVYSPPVHSPVHVPASLLSLHTISREMMFHSRHSLAAFRLTQSILFHSHLIEHWSFTFGFVIPDSSNSWQCVIAKGAADSAVGQPALTAQQLSGNVVIETRFWDGEQLIGISRIRVYYDGPE